MSEQRSVDTRPGSGPQVGAGDEPARVSPVRVCVSCGADVARIGLESLCPSCGTPLLVSFRMRMPYGLEESAELKTKIGAYGMTYAGLGCLILGWLFGFHAIALSLSSPSTSGAIAVLFFFCSVVFLSESPARARTTASQVITWWVLMVGAAASFALMLFSTS